MSSSIHRRTRTSAIMGCVALVVALGLVGFLSSQSGQSAKNQPAADTASSNARRGQGDTKSTGGGYFPALPQGHGPFVAGKQVTLDEAKSEIGFAIYRPQEDLASDASISAVWTEVVLPELNHAAIEYKSGITVILSSRPLGDPESNFESEASEIGPKAWVQVVHGTDALIIPAGIQSGSPASVTFVLSGVQIAIYHATLSTDDLIRVANSVGP